MKTSNIKLKVLIYMSFLLMLISILILTNSCTKEKENSELVVPGNKGELKSAVPNPGPYTLVIYQSPGNSVSAGTPITFQASIIRYVEPPILEEEAPSASGIENKGILKSQTPGVIYAVSWNFGDGNTAYGNLSVTHTYTNPGTYTITCTVKVDSYVCVATVKQIVLNGTLSVTYNGNGNTGGSVPVDPVLYAPGGTVTVFGNTGNLLKANFTFAGWNMASDGSGTTYAQGQTFIMGSSNVTLYAKWNSYAPSYAFTWGSYGNGIGQFKDPIGIVINSNGYVYVADNNNHRVQVFNSNGSYLFQFGSLGTGNGLFKCPWGIAVSSGGYIYVVEYLGHRVQVFNSNGTYLFKFGSYGTGNGQFNYPTGIAIAPNGYVYVIENSGNRIQVFNASGVYQFQFGSYGAGNGQFNYPIGIAIDSQGSVYVADTHNDRIQKFNSNGVYQSQFGSQGTGNGQFFSPNFIAFDKYGYIYITDSSPYTNRVQIFNPNGIYHSQFSLHNNGQSTPSPYGIAVAQTGNIYVVSQDGQSVQVFH
jgi:uncharacterized repeat protein (TIGR02543 family)